MLSLFSSCYKDGDFDLGPIHLQGEISPNLGLPIGEGHFSITEAMRLSQKSQARILVGSDSVVTIVYDTSSFEQLDISRYINKDYRDSVVYQETISGEVEIDLFENIDYIPDNEKLRCKGVWVTLMSDISSNSQSLPQDVLNRYRSAEVKIDSLKLIATSHDDRLVPITSILDTSYSLNLQSITNGNTNNLTILDSNNIMEIIDLSPKRLNYSIRVTVTVPVVNNTTPASIIRDTLGITELYLDSYLKVEFPLSMYLDSLKYQFDIATRDIDLKEWDIVSLKKANLYLEISNSFPVEFNMVAELQDSNNATLCPILNLQNSVLIQAPEVSYNPLSQTHTTSEPSVRKVTLELTQNQLDHLQNSDHLRINCYARTSTSTTPSTPKPIVSVTSDSKLSIRAYLQVQPSMNIDEPLK